MDSLGGYPVRKSLILNVLVAICLTGDAAPPAQAQGRAYIQREREIVKMTKVMVQESREAKEFADLLKELDSADVSESTREFWQTAREIRSAMGRELEQARERLEKEGAGEKRTSEAKIQKAETAATATIPTGEDAASSMSPQARRVHRMEMIIRETDGLRNPMSMNDESVMARYRLLVGEFHDLLLAEVDEMKEEIDTLKKMQRGARR